MCVKKNGLILAVLFCCVISYAEQKDFENPLTGKNVDWTTKPLSQWMELADQTRDERIKDALTIAADGSVVNKFCPFIAKLYLGNDLDAVNEELCGVLSSKNPNIRSEYRLHDHWDLSIDQILCHMYYEFGSKGRLAKGRLYPKTEKALLAELWDRTCQKNDIALARQSTWWMQGSENHDLVAKVGNLISSQIFMNEPDYAQRVYPDLGKGGGIGYWFHQMYADSNDAGPQGRGNFKDNKEYRAKEHYEAWVIFFKDYIRQRAKRGFFLEMAAPGYMQTTVTHITDIYDYCEDKQLQELTHKFLDVIWLEWAQDELDGIRGGAKTRVPDGCRHADAMYSMARFYFGGKGNSEGNLYTLFFSGYRLPELVWQLALDRQGLGCFEYVSRKVGEEQGITPRPLGMERTLMCDTESRFVRYSYVTPEYILGTQMDHPLAIHSHLSPAARWQGLTFRDGDGARVYPCDIAEDEKGHWKEGKNGYYRSVQYKNVLITQQCRKWTSVSPDWFPMPNTYNLPWGVCFGKKKLDEVVEAAGWIFVRHADAYLAVRPVLGKFHSNYRFYIDKSSAGLYEDLEENSYKWNSDRTFIKLEDNFCPVIMEAGRKADYRTFDDFMKYILGNSLKLQRTVVPGFYVVVYKSGLENVEITFNASSNEVPMINGKYIDYSPDFVFSSPYLKSQYNSGIIWAGFNGNQMTFDFTK